MSLQAVSNVILLVLLLTGCASVVTQEDVEKAQNMCEVKTIFVWPNEIKIVECKNGEIYPLAIKKEVI